MKTKKLFIFGAIILSSVMISSCNKASKAKPFLEKVIEREGAQAEKNVIREAEESTLKRTRTSRPRHHSSGDEFYSQPTTYYVQCGQCNGSGAIYVRDYYGNIQYDYYGNPMVSQCTNCGGRGQIEISN